MRTITTTNTLELEENHKDYLVSILGTGLNFKTLKEKFNENFSLSLTEKNFKEVLTVLEINLRRDNKTKFAHDETDFLNHVKSFLGKNYSKAAIYDEVNKTYPCSLVAFNSNTSSIDWKKDNRSTLTITVKK